MSLTTVADVLLGQARGERELRTRLADAGVVAAATAELGHTSASVCTAVGGQLADTVQELLEVDLADVVLAGWSSYDALRDAAARSLSEPAAPELVPLVSHRITSTHAPSVDVVLDGRRVARLVLTVELTLTLRSVIAVVRGGLLVRLDCGELEAEGTLSFRERTVLQRSGATSVAAAVPLGDGVPLPRRDLGAPAEDPVPVTRQRLP